MTSFRKITSLTLGLSFLTMSYTGLMLYIVPKGKIAYWADWHMLGLTKSEYGNIHTTSMIIFLSFAIIHIYYNWKPLVSYLKDTTKKISFTKKEFLIALSINIFFIVGTLYPIQPMKGILDVGQDIKEYWVEIHGNPPYGHAEESSLRKFTRKMGIDLEEAKEALDEKGIKYNSSDTLKDISRNNGLTPQEIYEIIQ